MQDWKNILLYSPLLLLVSLMARFLLGKKAATQTSCLLVYFIFKFIWIHLYFTWQKMSQKSEKTNFFWKKMLCVFSMHNIVSRIKFIIFQTDKVFPLFPPKKPKTKKKEINNSVTKMNNNIIICWIWKQVWPVVVFILNVFRYHILSHFQFF